MKCNIGYASFRPFLRVQNGIFLQSEHMHDYLTFVVELTRTATITVRSNLT
uniref:Uncharacterized protein n=1 Tax=Anguilla anguilla TaxID=7936 RepID=A0A0E9QA57_ANGAN